jgi:hypothetical protein
MAKVHILCALLFVSAVLATVNNFEVLQRNVANGRKVFYSDRNHIYIAEAGSGAGNDPCLVAGTCCGSTEVGPTCYGFTSRISRTNKHGRNYEVLVDGVGSGAIKGGLPFPAPGYAMSFGSGEMAVYGITSLMVVQNTMYYITGTLYAPPLSTNFDMASLYKVDLNACNPNCTSVKITNFAQQINSTQPFQISDPYHITEDVSAGTALVADAGTNKLYRVSLINGTILQSVYLPFVGGEFVPTTAEIGPDGYIYVGGLGSPHGPNAEGAKIVRVSPDFSSVTDYVTGLSNVIDLKFHDGELWYLQYQDLPYFTGDTHDGTLFKYNARRGESKAIKSFTVPGGFNFVDDSIVVTNFGGYPFGELVRLDNKY